MASSSRTPGAGRSSPAGEGLGAPLQLRLFLILSGSGTYQKPGSL